MEILARLRTQIDYVLGNKLSSVLFFFFFFFFFGTSKYQKISWLLFRTSLINFNFLYCAVYPGNNRFFKCPMQAFSLRKPVRHFKIFIKDV